MVGRGSSVAGWGRRLGYRMGTECCMGAWCHREVGGGVPLTSLLVSGWSVVPGSSSCVGGAVGVATKGNILQCFGKCSYSGLVQV